MSFHNICFHWEIRKKLMLFAWKKNNNQKQTKKQTKKQKQKKQNKKKQQKKKQQTNHPPPPKKKQQQKKQKKQKKHTLLELCSDNSNHHKQYFSFVLNTYIYHAMGKFSSWQTNDIFLIFPWKIGSDTSCNCFLRRQFTLLSNPVFQEK